MMTREFLAVSVAVLLPATLGGAGRARKEMPPGRKALLKEVFHRLCGPSQAVFQVPLCIQRAATPWIVDRGNTAGQSMPSSDLRRPPAGPGWVQTTSRS
ncbi:hypothetical protein B0T25DRAFT_524550 [Lasiosphaeria hispida]|uniref:Secreted protein n=1 Tax=Lasiosphaeria hispida TaxID=260671 RepID=A0AAJ0HTY4_9PEZI|nr:hypothetical protein B0T25DRAFT_524550 [Lasiosphaeria hispida]